MRWGPALLLAILLWPLVACGVRAQDGSEPVPVTNVLPTPDPPEDAVGRQDVSVYFVSGSRLDAVRRSAVDRRPQTAIDLLLAGPFRREVMGGLRTALSPQDLLVLSGPDGSGTAAVAVNREFTGIDGANQVLAVAQVVWTVTQFPEIDQVYFLFDGTPVEVPTDEGLTGQAVDRDDYRTVAPVPAEQAPSSSATSPDGSGSMPPGRPAAPAPSGGPRPSE